MSLQIMAWISEAPCSSAPLPWLLKETALKSERISTVPWLQAMNLPETARETVGTDRPSSSAIWLSVIGRRAAGPCSK